MKAIKTIKEDIRAQVLKIEDQSLLEEIKWLLDRKQEVNPLLLSSIKKGMQQAAMGKGVSHEEAKKAYSKWL